MKYFVYIHTCPNQKRYIGVTTRKPEIRWCNGFGYEYNNHFYRAIQKYGWDNIQHQVFETKSRQLMHYWEKILIYHYNTMKSELGYNKTSGGDSCFEVSEETKNKLSKSHKGRTAWNKGKKLPPRSDETKRKISIATTGKTSVAWNKGIPCSEEQKKKISETLKRKRTA